jgi:PAS domain S-box-containing protein
MPLTVRLLLPFTLFCLLGTVTLLVQTWQQHHEQPWQRLDVVAETALSLAQSPGISPGLNTLAETGAFTRLWIVQADGRILASSNEAEVGTMIEPAWGRFLSESSQRIVHSEARWGDRMMRFVARQSPSEGRWAVILADATQGASIPWANLGLILVAGVAGWGLTLLLARLALRSTVVRPLGQVQEMIGKLAVGEMPSEATLDRLWAEAGPFVQAYTRTLGELVRHYRALHGQWREAEARVQTLYDLMPSMGLIATFEGQVVDVNPAFCTLLGVERERLQGQPLSALARLLPVDGILRLAHRSRQGGLSFSNLDTEFTALDGRIIPVRVSLQLVRYNGVWSFLMIGEDLSEASRDQSALGGDAAFVGKRPARHVEQLRQEVDMLTRMVDASGLLIVALDAAGRTVHWNQGAVQLTGYEAQDVPDLPTMVRVLMPQTDTWQQFKGWLANQSYETPLVGTFTTRQGETVPVRWRAVPLTGTHLSGMLIGQVVAEPVAARPEVLPVPVPTPTVAPKLESAVEPAVVPDASEEATVIEQMLCQLQDEVAAVANLAEVVYQKTDKRRKDREALVRLREATRSLDTRLQLLHARYNLHAGAARMQALDLAAVATEAIALCVADFDLEHRPVEIQTESRLPVVHGDPFQVRQLLRHLFHAAVQACPVGTVAMHVRGQRVAGGCILWVEARTTGTVEMLAATPSPEVPQEALSEAGLRQAFCEKVVRLHGGRLWVDVEGKNRVTFFVHLPDQPGLPVPALRAEAELEVGRDLVIPARAIPVEKVRWGRSSAASAS